MRACGGDDDDDDVILLLSLWYLSAIRVHEEMREFSRVIISVYFSSGWIYYARKFLLASHPALISPTFLGKIHIFVSMCWRGSTRVYVLPVERPLRRRL